MKWTVEQCRAQESGIAALEAVKLQRSLSKAEKQTLAIAKSHFSAYGCKKTLKSADTLVVSDRPLVATPFNPSPEPKNMSLLSVIGDVVGGLTGRTSDSTGTSGPDTADSPSLLSGVVRGAASVLGAVLPGASPAVAAANLGTLGDSGPIGRGTGTGRAIAPLRLEAGGDISYPGDTLEVASGGVRLPQTSKVRRLVHLVGVVQAAALLGLPIGVIAMIATRPYRRRGISAAALRTTRRTIRAVNSISHSLSKLKACRRR